MHIGEPSKGRCTGYGTQVIGKASWSFVFKHCLYHVAIRWNNLIHPKQNKSIDLIIIYRDFYCLNRSNLVFFLQTSVNLKTTATFCYICVDVYIFFKLGCNKNCLKQVCNASGFCIQGCVDGYWEHTCDLVCPVNCTEPSCIRSTGQCVTCVSGFWGDTCILQCSSFCYGGVCGRTNGKCTLGCTLGRNGEICDRICSSGCKNGTCDQHLGICLGGCKQNWSGDYCDSKYWK